MIRERSWTVAAAATVVIGCALCAAPLAGHSDEVDKHFYTVLARHMAESGGWFEPTYLPWIHQRFRDHLPFGIWPWALAIRAFGEGALAPLALLCSLGTLALVLFVGARVFGRPAAVVGALILASTESFFRYAGQPTLDRLLVVLVTAATLPLWRPVPVPPSRWICSAAFTALAVLVKGPFGLLPLAATVVARAVVLRSGRDLFSGGLAIAAATMPAAGFLAVNRWFGDGSWWRGYVLGQLYASARGLRGDGEQGLVPLKSLAGRFWPGLPLTLWGMTIGVRDFSRRCPTAGSIVAIHALATVALLCVPSRKIWHHALVVYPALALLAGAAVTPLAERLVISVCRERSALLALVGSACALAMASAAGLGAWLTPRVCLVPPRLAGLLRPGTAVLVVAPDRDWRAVALLAAEHRLVPWPATSFSGPVPLEESSGPMGCSRFASAALVRSDVPAVQHPGWRARAHEGNWTLWMSESIPGR